MPVSFSRSVVPIDAWAPNQSIGAPRFWYDFTDLSSLTVDGSNLIGAANDKTTNLWHLTQGLGDARKPVYTPNVANGKSAAVFTRASFQYLYRTSIVFSQPFMLFAAYRTRTVDLGTNTYQELFDGNFNETGSRIIWWYQMGDGTHAPGVNPGTTPVGSSLILQSDRRYYQTGIVDGTSSGNRINGQSISGLGASGTASTADIMIGSVNNALDLSLLSIFCIDGLDSTDRANAERYCKNLLGL